MAQPVLHRSSTGAPVISLPEEALPCLGTLLQATGLGLACVDAELRFQFVNPALTVLSGLPRSAYDGRSVAEVWPGLVSTLMPLLHRAVAGESVLGARVSGVPSGATGAPRHFRVSLWPVAPGSPGTPRGGVSLTVEDDTARVKQELALRESEERLRGLVTVACDGYCLHAGGLILEASTSLAQLMGTTPEEMVGQPFMRWFAPESRESVQRAVARQVDSPYEATGLRADGKRLFLELVPQNTEREGRPVRMAAVWDISARKAAEEAASRADTFREQLMRVVGHDLRAPLRTLQSNVEALRSGGGLNEVQQRQVTHASTALQRVERITHQLMDYTRARLAGGLSVHPTPLALNHVLGAVADRFQTAHPTRSLVCKTEGDLVGTWDEARLVQLLDNLIGNALQHGPEDTPIEVRLSSHADGVTLSVRNEGSPVALEDRSALFEPFKRGKRARGEGLGLGLYLVRQIAVAHGGRVSVETGTGLGTRFVVWLPRHAPGG